MDGLNVSRMLLPGTPQVHCQHILNIAGTNSRLKVVTQPFRTDHPINRNYNSSAISRNLFFAILFNKALGKSSTTQT